MNIHNQKLAAAQSAIDIAGGPTSLARQINALMKLGADLTYDTVRKWSINNGIPAKYIQAVHIITGIPRHRLAPDVFGHEDPMNREE